MRLFDDKAAEQFSNYMNKGYKVNVEEYNQEIINNINKVTDSEDYLMLFGNITEGSLSDTKKYLSQLKSIWEVVDLKDQPLFKIEELWTDMGAKKALTLDGFIGGDIQNEQVNVIISTSSSNVKFWLGTNHYIAMPESTGIENELLKENERYKDKIYNISLSAHNYKPVLINQIPQQINEYLNLSKGDI